VEIKPVISCEVSVIMGRATVPPRQFGRNGHAQARYEGGSAQVNSIVL
jgi:hypothetical protein